ncbi:MAG: pimeloyl-ACP methyl ester carboxylesterase [Oleispira sp.]|jgi:pimeloyl-ACP methyl ester carboxylesterase
MFNDFNACDKFDVMNQLADINIPVQIMVGEKDMMTPVKYASFLQDRLSNSELKIISGGTHMVFAEQAEVVNKHIQGFVERIIL